MSRRNYFAPPDEDRCVWDITLRSDKSGARCMRRKTEGDLCTQHAKMRDAFGCDYCGGNDEHPPGHCADCTRPEATTQAKEE